MPVLLAGAFGQRNPGDEALLASFVQALRGYPLVATTSDPVQTESEHGIATVSAQDPRAVAREIAPRRRRGVRRRDDLQDAASAQRPAAARAAAHGLGVAAATRALRATRWRSWASGRRRSRRAAPARWPARSSTAPTCSCCAMRSPRACSPRPARRRPFRVGADASWTRVEPPARAERPRRRRDRRAEPPRGRPRAGGPPGARARPAARAGLRLRLQPWQVLDGPDAQDDVALARTVAAQLARAAPRSCRRRATLDDARDLFAGARLVVALRFHALVAAAAAGVPAIAYAHEAKLAGLGKRLGQPVVQPAGTAEAVGGAMLAAIEDGTARASPAASSASANAPSRAWRCCACCSPAAAAPRRAAVSGLELAPTGWIA